jgi:hypothetical protein
MHDVCISIYFLCSIYASSLRIPVQLNPKACTVRPGKQIQIFGCNHTKATLKSKNLSPMTLCQEAHESSTWKNTEK